MERKISVELVVEFVERNVEADAGVENELHAEALDQFDFAAQDGLRQTVFGNGKTQHAAGFGLTVEDGDVVAEHGEIERGGESGGTCARDGDLAAGGFELPGDDRFDHRLVAFGREHRSAMKRWTSRMFTASSKVWRRQRLSQGCWQTRPVEAGQRIVENDGLECVFEAAFL